MVIAVRVMMDYFKWCNNGNNKNPEKGQNINFKLYDNGNDENKKISKKKKKSHKNNKNISFTKKWYKEDDKHRLIKE